MSSDKKNLSLVDWASPSDEQLTFGSQSPYASSGSVHPAAPYDLGAGSDAAGLSPTAPSAPEESLLIPADAPPMYTKDPSLPIQELPTPQQRAPQAPQQLRPVPVSQPVQQARSPHQALPQDLQQGQPYSPQQQYYPQSHQPLLQQQQHPTYHPSAGVPVNYGATPSLPYEGSVVPRGPDAGFSNPASDPQRRRSCWVDPDTANTRKDFKTISPSSDLGLKLDVLDGITGNVVVKESESWSDLYVRVNVVMQATSSELLRGLELSLVGEAPKVNAKVHISDTYDSETKKRLMREHCARADVEIVYPRAHPGTGKLQVSVVNGEVTMNIGRRYGMPATFDEVQVSLTNGDVNFDNLIVGKLFEANVGNGHAMGLIRTTGKVVVIVMNGPVHMELDSEHMKDDWKVGGKDMDVDITSVNGRVNLELYRRFVGHFDVTNGNGQKNINLASDSKNDTIVYTARSAKQLKGWISADGTEPQGSLPRLNLVTVNGPISLDVGTGHK
ncbi:hypothetical protein BGZ99_009150 [Dissophora globulifera]|uniref:Adhesin domain-containing protein n=1 Tax=Dissophora globulifera TaxID=979702 RepID=A0A9P6R9B3_9FUNG|nr:hypothetical protein BGZ99_009150 [Dissophora globulifera]